MNYLQTISLACQKITKTKETLINCLNYKPFFNLPLKNENKKLHRALDICLILEDLLKAADLDITRASYQILSEEGYNLLKNRLSALVSISNYVLQHELNVDNILNIFTALGFEVEEIPRLNLFMEANKPKDFLPYYNFSDYQSVANYQSLSQIFFEAIYLNYTYEEYLSLASAFYAIKQNYQEQEALNIKHQNILLQKNDYDVIKAFLEQPANRPLKNQVGFNTLNLYDNKLVEEMVKLSRKNKL